MARKKHKAGQQRAHGSKGHPGPKTVDKQPGQPEPHVDVQEALKEAPLVPTPLPDDRAAPAPAMIERLQPEVAVLKGSEPAAEHPTLNDNVAIVAGTEEDITPDDSRMATTCRPVVSPASDESAETTNEAVLVAATEVVPTASNQPLMVESQPTGLRQEPPAQETLPKRRASTAKQPRKLSALTAAAQLLTELGTALTCKEIIGRLAAEGRWASPNGKTPDATLHAAILREIKAKGDQTRFFKVERGRFAARLPG